MSLGKFFMLRWIEQWRSTGRRGERIAARYLEKQGYRIIRKNLRVYQAEIDLLALSPDRATWVFVEVKTSTTENARPEHRVHPQQQRRLARAAMLYVQAKKMQHKPIRFDIVAVVLGGDAKQVRHYANAFTLNY